MNPSDPVADLQSKGVAALRDGDAQGALVHFGQATALRPDDADLWLGLAYAQVQSEAIASALNSLDKALQRDPRHLRSLILKGDLFDLRHQPQAAASCYRAALRAAPPPAQLPASLRHELTRIQSRSDALQADFAAAIDEVAQRSAQQSPDQSGRFRSAVDILLGRQPLYLPQPRQLYFPGLAGIPFHDRTAFPWLRELEAQTSVIRQELLALQADEAWFEPYVAPDPNRPVLNQSGLYNNRDWSACFLSKNGQVNPRVVERCPTTWKAVQQTPLVQVPGRSPSVLFSRLRPQTHIPAHHGFYNTRLIVHLPLIVPPGCRFRVGAETREWEEGKAWIFDDTIEHEAWNDSDQDRIILLFEVWRPELSAQEHEWIRTLFETLDRQGAAAPAGDAL